MQIPQADRPKESNPKERCMKLLRLLNITYIPIAKPAIIDRNNKKDCIVIFINYI